jgi:hypothetical protein
LENGSIFTSGPTPENPPKRYLVANVQKNYLGILFAATKSGNEQFACGRAPFIPVLLQAQG